MIPRHHPGPELVRLARAQHHVVSREQALALGLTDRVIQRLTSEGVWTPLARGVYVLGDVVDWLALAWAGTLIGGDRSVLGLEAAGHLQGLVRQPPAQLPVFVGASAHVRRGDPWRFIRADRVGTGAPTRTGPARTVLDLCAERAEDEIAALLAEGINQGITTAAQVRQLLASTRRHPHRRLLESMLTDVAEGSHSALEVRYARDVERAHRLPRAVRQAGPTRRHRTDVWYPAFDVVVELDGHLHHRGLAAFHDMSRDNLHRLRGLVTLRYGWPHVTGQPCLVAGQVGWPSPRRGGQGRSTRVAGANGSPNG